MTGFIKRSHHKKKDLSPKTTSPPQNTSNLSPLQIQSPNTIDPQQLTEGEILYLQRTIGNAALNRMITQRSSSKIQRDDTPGSSSVKKYELDQFDHEGISLTSDHLAQIAVYAAEITMVLQDNPGATIKIIGHADATGSNETNENFGQGRADTVQNVLVKLGVPSDRISSVTNKGETELKVKTEKQDGRNRRVEIIMSGISASPATNPGETPDAPAPEGDKTPADAPKSDADDNGIPSPDATTDEDTKDKPKLKPNASAAFIPYQGKLVLGKGAQQKTLGFKGFIGIDYLFMKDKSGNFEIKIPASAGLAMSGAFGHEEQKYKLGVDPELGINIIVIQSPFENETWKDLYVKYSAGASASVSMLGETTGTFTLGNNLKSELGYKMGPATLYIDVKGSMDYEIGAETPKFSLGGSSGLKISF